MGRTKPLAPPLRTSSSRHHHDVDFDADRVRVCARLRYIGQMLKTFEQWRTQVCPASDFRFADAAFALDHVELTGEPANNSESKLRLTATGRRHNDDGAYVTERVTAMFLARDGSLVRVQRYHDDDSPLIVGRRTSWSHQIYDGELAATHSVRYVVETRLNVFRPIMTCELGPGDLFAETATWPIVAKDVVKNDLVALEIALASRRGKRLDISVLADSTVTNRALNVTAEYTFLDGEGVAVASATSSSSLQNNLANDRSSAGIERTGSAIRSLAVRARIEATLLSELGPIELPPSSRPSR